ADRLAVVARERHAQIVVAAVRGRVAGRQAIFVAVDACQTGAGAALRVVGAGARAEAAESVGVEADPVVAGETARVLAVGVLGARRADAALHLAGVDRRRSIRHAGQRQGDEQPTHAKKHGIAQSVPDATP